MKLIASRRFNYNGRPMKPGEDFTEPDRQTAEDLIAVGAARAYNNAKKPQQGTYKRRDVSAEE
jgi:hypothetical protein